MSKEIVEYIQRKITELQQEYKELMQDIDNGKTSHSLIRIIKLESKISSYEACLDIINLNKYGGEEEDD